jgi:quinol monooxygenase YgiN
MYEGLARLTAKVGKIAELLAFLQWDAAECRLETGTLRFDAWFDPAWPDSVVLYEAYVDADAFELHQAGAPFKKFTAEVVPDLVESVDFIVPFGFSTISNADPYRA